MNNPIPRQEELLPLPNGYSLRVEYLGLGTPFYRLWKGDKPFHPPFSLDQADDFAAAMNTRSSIPAGADSGLPSLREAIDEAYAALLGAKGALGDIANLSHALALLKDQMEALAPQAPTVPQGVDAAGFLLDAEACTIMARTVLKQVDFADGELSDDMLTANIANVLFSCLNGAGKRIIQPLTERNGAVEYPQAENRAFDILHGYDEAVPPHVVQEAGVIIQAYADKAVAEKCGPLVAALEALSYPDGRLYGPIQEGPELEALNQAYLKIKGE